MIISASRRCDLPAFRMEELMAWLDSGEVEVANPFFPGRSKLVDLRPGAVDCLVFWTRDPRPLLTRAAELESRGYAFLVQATITGYPRALEPGVLPAEEACAALRSLAERIGPERIAWRYDPILLDGAARRAGAPRLDADWHKANFERLARSLEGASERLVLSLVDEYGGTRARLRAAGIEEPLFAAPRGGPGAARPLAAGGGLAPAAAAASGQSELPGLLDAPAPGEPLPPSLPPEPWRSLLRELAAGATARGFAPRACAEPWDLAPLGLGRSACVDPDWIEAATGRVVPRARDRGQRPACGCAASVDIGSYGPCPAACAYCYARKGGSR